MSKTDEILVERYYEILVDQLDLYASNIEMMRERMRIETDFFLDELKHAESRLSKKDDIKQLLLNLGKLGRAIEEIDLDRVRGPLNLIFRAIDMLIPGWQEGEGRTRVAFSVGMLSQGWFSSLDKSQTLLADVLRFNAAELREEHVTQKC